MPQQGRTPRLAYTSPTLDRVSRTATIGLDAGGTKVAGGLLTASNELLEVRQRSSLVNGRRDPGLGVTRRVAEELMDLARAAA